MSQATSTATALLAPGVWEIDRDHSNVEFVTRHLLSRVRGRFSAFTGTIQVAPEPTDSTLEVAIQAASIDTNHPERDRHLQGPEFLDADRFPTLSFRSTSIGTPDGAGRLRVDGDLTIRDVTRPVVLDVEFLGAADDPWGGTRAGFSGRTEIDRDDFGASWNVVLDTGGLLVGKKVAIELEIEAVRQVGPLTGGQAVSAV